MKELIFGHPENYSKDDWKKIRKIVITEVSALDQELTTEQKINVMNTISFLVSKNSLDDETEINFALGVMRILRTYLLKDIVETYDTQ